MKFLTQTHYYEKKVQEEQTQHPQEMSFATTQNQSSLARIINAVSQFMQSLDHEESQQLMAQVIFDPSHNSIALKILRHQPSQHQLNRSKYIPYLNNAIKKYQKIQQATLLNYTKAVHQLRETKKFIHSWRQRVQLLYRQLSPTVDIIEEPLIKNRTFSEDTNASLQDKQDTIQKFKRKFQNKGTVFYPSCLFEVD